MDARIDRQMQGLVAVRALERLCLIQFAKHAKPGMLADMRGRSDVRRLLGALAKSQRQLKKAPEHSRLMAKKIQTNRPKVLRKGRPTEKKSLKTQATKKRRYLERLRQEGGARLANRKAKQHAAYKRWYAKLKENRERLATYRADQNRGYKDRLVRSTIGT